MSRLVIEMSDTKKDPLFSMGAFFVSEMCGLVQFVQTGSNIFALVMISNGNRIRDPLPLVPCVEINEYSLSKIATLASTDDVLTPVEEIRIEVVKKG